jgi:Xaa-Pro aminopeptidase
MSHAPSPALERRHRIVRHDIAARGLDALVVTSLPNILYLTNFTGSSAVAVVTADRLFFITDFRYTTTMAAARGTPSECPTLELVTVDGSYDATLALLLGTAGWRRIGFEAAHLTVGRFDWLKATLASHASPSPALVGTERVVERARVRKDAYEIETLREAARRLSQVAAAVVTSLQRGQTEREFAFAIDCRIRQAGFERSAFETIVASGPNAALPHARPGGRTITEGDLVVLDFGGVHDSYCVDLTRTVSVGPASTRAREVHAAVREAHDRAIVAVAPGRSRFDIDAAARDTLTGRGLGDAFGHGTGHGLGVEVHEDPRITRRRADVDTDDEEVAPGMIFTIEPGAYLPGWGGVRIEDDVLVTDDGVEVLTDVTTDLIEV